MRDLEEEESPLASTQGQLPRVDHGIRVGLG